MPKRKTKIETRVNIKCTRCDLIFAVYSEELEDFVGVGVPGIEYLDEVFFCPFCGSEELRELEDEEE